jgi:NB-ARC domain
VRGSTKLPSVTEGSSSEAGFSGGSGGAGGYRFQALAAAYVYAHALAEHGLNWVAGGVIPLAVSAETAGPGDDLRVEYLGSSGAGSSVLEVQAKRGLRKGAELWDALVSLTRGLDEDSSLRCALLVDHAASRSVRDELRRDIERLAQGRSDRLRPITREFLRRLEAEGITPGRSLLTRLSVIVADLGDQSEGEGTALVLLSKVVDKASILNAWTAFREDGMRLAEIAGRRDVPALWDMLEAQGIRAADGGEPLLSQREDQVPPYPRPFVGRDAVVGEISALLSAAGGGSRPVVAVRGLPGSGKTAVAAAVADGLRSTFHGGILWAALGPNPSPLSVLAGWGRALGAEDLAGYQDAGAASARMKAVRRDSRALLVLDDVGEAEHARPFAVGGPESATLATTRSRGAARGMAPGGTVLGLDPLTEAEAVSLLEQLAPSLDEDDRRRLDELAAKLGRLPLALGVAGRLLEEEATLGLGVGALLAELEQGERLLAATVPPDLSGLVEATTPTVAALLERSTDVLTPRAGAFRAPGRL